MSRRLSDYLALKSVIKSLKENKSMLHSIDLTGNSALTPDRLKELGLAAETSRFLQSFTLHSYDFKIKHFSTFILSISHSCIRKISLSESSFDDPACLSWLIRSPHLEEISLNKIFLRFSVFVEFLQALENQPESKLQCLEFRNCSSIVRVGDFIELCNAFEELVRVYREVPTRPFLEIILPASISPASHEDDSLLRFIRASIQAKDRIKIGFHRPNNDFRQLIADEEARIFSSSVSPSSSSSSSSSSTSTHHQEDQDEDEKSKGTNECPRIKQVGIAASALLSKIGVKPDPSVESDSRSVLLLKDVQKIIEKRKNTPKDMETGSVLLFQDRKKRFDDINQTIRKMSVDQITSIDNLLDERRQSVLEAIEISASAVELIVKPLDALESLANQVGEVLDLLSVGENQSIDSLQDDQLMDADQMLDEIQSISSLFEATINQLEFIELESALRSRVGYLSSFLETLKEKLEIDPPSSSSPISSSSSQSSSSESSLSPIRSSSSSSSLIGLLERLVDFNSVFHESLSPVQDSLREMKKSIDGLSLDVGSLKPRIERCTRMSFVILDQLQAEFESKLKARRSLEMEIRKTTQFFQEWLSSYDSHVEMVEQVEQLRLNFLTVEDELVVQEALLNSYKSRGRSIDDALEKRVKQLKQDVTISLNELRKNQAMLTKFAGQGGIPEIQIKYHQLFYSDVIMTTGLVSSNTLKSYDSFYEVESRGNNHRLLRAKKGDAEFAIKEYLLSSEKDRKGFEREACILHKIRNPFVVPINCVFYDIDKERGCVGYVELPFISNGTLEVWRKSTKRSKREIQRMMRMIVQGLSFLHISGIIHRDLKPSNILIDSNGIPLISDFDLSKDTTTDLTQTLNFMSTQDVIPPEIEMGEGATSASDIFSIGVVLFKLLFPNRDVAPVFLSKTLDLPPCSNQDALDLLQQCLKTNPMERPSADQVLTHRFFTTVTEVDHTEESRAKISALLDHLRLLRVISERDRSTADVYIRRYSPNGITKVLDAIQVLDSMSPYLSSSGKLQTSIRCHFDEEPGIDAGGLLSSMYSYFFDACFSPDSPLMESRDQGTFLPRFFINEYSSEDSRAKFKLFGAIIIKCMFDGRQPIIKFPNLVYRFLLDPKVNGTLNDLDSFDLETARGLKMLLASEGVDSWMLTFEGLKPMGELIDVTDANKLEYVNLKAHHILIKSREENLKAIREGFLTLDGLSTHLAMFTPYDLKLAMFGEQYISADDIICLLEFVGFGQKFEEDFIQAIQELTVEELRLFLHFVTSNFGIPIGGLVNPNSRETKIEIRQSSVGVPVSHTCFFRLDCFEYESKDKISSMLRVALCNHQQTAGSFDVQ